jgi:hypothetical protein
MQAGTPHFGRRRKLPVPCVPPRQPDRLRISICAGLAVLAVAFAPLALGQTCSFNPSQPNAVSFGTVNPLNSTPATFTITLNYRCTGSATAVITINGANDTGPGAYRLRNIAQPTQYMAYTIATTNVPGTKITLDGTLTAAAYQNAFAGNYSDTLNVNVLP